jgi:hypothetical protein
MNARRFGVNPWRQQGAVPGESPAIKFSNASYPGAVLHIWTSSGDGTMQDFSQTLRNILLVGFISFGASLAGCTVVEEDDDGEADVQFQADDLEDDEDFELEIED